MIDRKPLIVFQVEAGAAIGFGHLMRCLSLATALRDKVIILFNIASADDVDATQMVRAAGFDLVEGALPVCDAEIFDGYGFSDETISASRTESLRRHCLILIDDLGGRRLDCDLIICPGPQRKAADYDVPSHCRFLLGPSFALVNPVFGRYAGRPFSNSVGRLFLGFGGSDPVDASATAVGWLQCLPVDAVDLLLGAGYRGKLKTENSVPPQFTIHKSIAASEVAELMSQCDAAIVAPSTMSLELVALARPTLLFAISPTQIDAGVALHEAGLCCYGGSILDSCQEDFFEKVTDFCSHVGRREKLHQKCSTLNPVLGAARVAEVVMSILRENMQG